MLKMMTYSEANAVLGSSLSPNNYCICKKTALENGADPDQMARYIQAGSPSLSNVTSAQTNGHQYVDLGLPSRTLWAKCNVGASSETAYGTNYQYGKTTTQVSATDPAYTGSETTLNVSNDVARSVMGGAWRMPTLQQYEELYQNTTYTVTTVNGVAGGKFTAANGNYVFFPFAGFTYFVDNSPRTDDAGGSVYMWTSTGMGGTINSPVAAYTWYMTNQRTDSYEVVTDRKRMLNVKGVLNRDSIIDTIEGNRLVPAAAVTLPAAVTYTIRFLDWDGTVLKTESVTAGSNPTPPANPTRTDYTFTGWSPSIGAASQNQDYTATYSYNGGGGDEPTPTTYYTITWYDSLDSSWSATSSVAEGSTPYYSAPSHSGYDFSGWSPTPVAAYSDTSYTAQYNESTPVEPEPEYAIYCEGVADGGTVYVDVHQTSLSISWDGPTPKDQQWDVRGSGPGQAQAGYSSWGSGYLNNLDFTSTTTIQSGASVGYTVYAIHPSSGGSTSISGSWEVRVVESH